MKRNLRDFRGILFTRFNCGTALAEQFDSTGAGPVARHVSEKSSAAKGCRNNGRQWACPIMLFFLGGVKIHLTQKKMTINYLNVFFEKS